MKKRLLTIVLAIALLSSMLALPAAASEIEPRVVMMDCDSCGTPCPVRTRKTSRTQPFTEAACAANPDGAWIHDHLYRIYEEYIQCETCGDDVLAEFAKVYCGDDHDIYVRTTEKRHV